MKYYTPVTKKLMLRGWGTGVVNYGRGVNMWAGGQTYVYTILVLYEINK